MSSLGRSQGLERGSGWATSQGLTFPMLPCSGVELGDVSYPKCKPGLRVPGAAGTAVTKYHRLSGLNNTDFFPHRSGGWRSKVEVLAELVPSMRKGHVPGLSLSFWWFAGNLWCSLVYRNIAPISTSSLDGVLSIGVCLCSNFPSLSRPQLYWIRGLPYSSMTSSLLITPATTLLPNQITF